MPKGPQGQKKPADVIGNAVMIARIATGEIEDLKPSYQLLNWYVVRSVGRAEWMIASVFKTDDLARNKVREFESRTLRTYFAQ